LRACILRKRPVVVLPDRPLVAWLGNREPEIFMNNKFKVLQAIRNWSQADHAEHLDVSRQSVNALETGKYDPSLPLAFKIARLFQLPIEEIFELEPASEPEKRKVE
jgi:putative transcriptional regulator